MTPFEPGSDPDEVPVLERLAGVKSKVARPDRSWGFYVGILVIAVIGVAVFSALNRSRGAHAAGLQPQASAPPPVMPSPAAGSSAAASQPAPLMMPTLPPASAAAPGGEDPAARWRAPSLIVDIGEDASSAGVGSPGTVMASATKPAGPGDSKPSTDDRFGEHFGGAGDTAVATRLADTALIVPQGAVAPAILETAINSDLPGFVRAVVSRDVRGFDGSTVLIPRGSKLIGQYKSGVAAGQSRAFVIWSRLITPAGVSVDLASPAADRLGRGGLEGETNSHFFQRFGGSMLLSVLSAGLDAVASRGSGGNATAIVIASPQQATNIASIALQKRIDIPDTITVPQGAPIRVFIARDLDFSGVMRKAP